MRLGFYNIQGGTGKTTIAANIGYYLSDKTKTVYVDCDIYAGCGALLFGFEDSPHTLNSYLSGTSSLTDIIHQFDDLSVIVADSTPNSFNTEINQKRMLELIRVLNDNYDIVLLDLPPNITEGNLLFSSLNLEEKVVNKMIVVAEDSIPGIANTMKTKELLYAVDIDCIGVIVNKFKDTVDFDEALDDIIAILPYDKKVENQWMENVPAVQMKSKFSKELSYLAEDLAEVYIKKDLAAVRALKVAKELKDMTSKKQSDAEEGEL
ncbi:MinD/ParA family ATP-binding protein [Methanococcus sp. CF]